MAPSTRRGLLRALVATAFVGVAGCGADGRGDSTVRTPSADDSPAAGTSTPPRPGTDPPSVRLPGGRYTIGTDSGPRDAQPAHEVSLAAFEIDVYEVTNAAFAAFLNDLEFDPLDDAPPGQVTAVDLSPAAASLLLEGPEGAEERPLAALDDEHSRIGIADGRFVVEPGYEAHPVNEVTWDGARRYAAWRGTRLPTEAEWEAATRGFEARLYPWGDSPPTPERAVYGRDSGETAPVGTHPAGATPRGIHDMAGNVSEWTSSLYRPYPYDADDGRENLDVRGERVTRGGAHVFFEPRELRAYYRTGFSREFDRGHRHIGFRCARSVDEG